MNNFEQIENGLFEVLRLRLVADGYLPDYTTFGVSPTYDRDAFEAAVEALRLTQPVIYLHNESNFDVRTPLNYTHVWIDRKFDRPGEIWGGGVIVTGDSPTTVGEFAQCRLPNQSLHVTYQANYITNRTDIDQYLSSLFNQLFGRNAIQGIFNDETLGGVFDVVRTEAFTNETRRKDWIERGLRFEARNVFVDDPEIIEDNIQPLEIFDAQVTVLLDPDDIVNPLPPLP